MNRHDLDGLAESPACSSTAYRTPLLIIYLVLEVVMGVLALVLIGRHLATE